MSRTYPDRGHGAFVAMGVPPDTGLIHFPLRAGRWLEPGDRGTDAVVLNHVAVAQSPGVRVGDTVLLSIGGKATAWKLVGIVEEIGSAEVAYAADDAFARQAGTQGAVRLVRAATAAADAGERAALMQGVETALASAGAHVESVQPLAELRTAMGDHVLVLVRMLVAMAAILATVGVLGLVSAMGVSVVERTRELAILRTLGATPLRITHMLLSEGLAVAGASFALGWMLSVPLTSLVDRIVGQLGFLAPLPLVFSPGAAAAWIALGGVATFLATHVPARAASALSIREGLGRT